MAQTQYFVKKKRKKEPRKVVVVPLLNLWNTHTSYVTIATAYDLAATSCLCSYAYYAVFWQVSGKLARLYRDGPSIKYCSLLTVTLQVVE